ncbi:MAG TPA: hypothetical protein VIT45_00105 [Allosphingosinicella sp.]
MKRILAAAALMFGAAQLSATTVESGTGDWSNIPEMRQMVDSIDSDTVAAIHEMIESGECTIEGQRAGKLDMTVPFLIQVNESGKIDRLVVEKFGCEKAEGLLAGALLKLLDRGGYRPKGGMHEGWFRGDVSFAHS